MLQLIKNNINIGFVKYRWYGFILSTILIIMGLIAIVQIWRGQAPMGVDFAGGTAVEIEFQKPMTAEKLREAIKTPAFSEVNQQAVREPGRYKYMLRIVAPGLPTEKVSTRVIEILKEKVPDNPVSLLASDDVGPAVSAKLREQTLMAIFWAMVGILVYIWFRYDFRFAVAGTVATIHDILAVLGITYFLGQQVDLLLITALLTIAGYSINDTVVIFDRIRENLRMRRKDDFVKITNDSLNETLSRTIITSLCTFFVVISLFLFGGEVIYSFALAMVIGLIIGCYSSIFVAANFVVEWNMHSPSVRR